jgi:hypothetical protein
LQHQRNSELVSVHFFFPALTDKFYGDGEFNLAVPYILSNALRFSVFLLSEPDIQKQQTA